MEERLILKFGDHDEELADDIALIRHETVRVNVATYIFDYIALSLPMKKLHPRFRTEEDESQDETDGLLVYQSQDEPEEQQPDNGDVDPRWAALQKLKGKE